MTESIKIYHNPRCSKSRQTLTLLEDNGVTPEVILYLEQTPDEKTIKDLLEKLGISARDLLRKGEDAFKELNLKDSSLDDDFLIKKMAEFPKLIERPIVVKGNKAILGRPPENILKLL